MCSVSLWKDFQTAITGLLSLCPVLTARSRPNTKALADPGSASSACSPVIGQEDGGEEDGICLPGQQTSGI